MIQAVKGTRDFFPELMAFRTWLYGHIRSVSGSFGYQEFDGPFLERLELYAAKSSEELIQEQAYVFTDRSGDKVALRPELTPTLARMVAQRVRAMPLPIRWWSFGPFWRYEQPQKGRNREFFQWNVDLLGLDRPQADAEIAVVAARFFEAIGLGPELVQIHVNSRRLVERQLDDLGLDPSLHGIVFRLIDRREKLQEQEWIEAARESGLDQHAVEGLSHILEMADAWRGSEELASFFNAVDTMGASSYIHYDPTVIRGLDYYTGIVFEARDQAGQHRAILGGGRYDNLVAAVGGDPVPGVGFAMGDVIVELVLRERGRFPDLRPNPADVLMTNFDLEVEGSALILAREMRQSGLRVEWYPEPGSLAKQLRYANRYAIPFVVILGPDELASGQVSIKDMRSGEQITMDRSEAAPHIHLSLAN
jgi:histidyl-tRNA synthetase